MCYNVYTRSNKTFENKNKTYDKSKTSNRQRH